MSEHYFVRFNLLNVTATEIAFMINKMQIAISAEDLATLPQDMIRHVSRVEIRDGVNNTVPEGQGAKPTEADSTKAA